MEPLDPDPADTEHRLLEVLDRGFARIQRRAGDYLPCRRGCHDCCFGPFPITRLDVFRLREGLRRADPEIAASIAAAAREAIVKMRAKFPGDAEEGRVVDDRPALDRYFESLSELACPVLDRETGACRLWEHRPVACRTYGPPLSFEGEPAPHCNLCFVDASEEEIEACRWSPDPEGLEQRALRAVGVEDGDDWETLIAYAVIDREAT